MGYILYNILKLFQFILFIRAISSWFPDVSRSAFGRFLINITEPVLSPVREFLNRTLNLSIPIDLSLLAVYLITEILAVFVLYI